MEFKSKSVQSKFNEYKGIISEFQDGEKFCSFTLSVGHENPRHINFTVKKPVFDELKEKHSLGDRVAVTHYAVSNKKADRWYTTLIPLSVSID